MIDQLTHFYRIGRDPFQSLSALPNEEAVRKMTDLYVEGSTIWERFKDPLDYLLARRQTEEWLRTEFIARGGRPQEPYPIYMVFGRTRWLEVNEDPATAATTAEIDVPVSLFTMLDISFTFPDSMITRQLAQQTEADCYLPDFFGKLFTLPEMLTVVRTRGLPGEAWGLHLPDDCPNYIEAQIWNHQILFDFQHELISKVQSVSS